MEGYASLTPQKMINYFLNLIRYDLPFLIVGSSSIGKSFTIIALAEKYNIYRSLLYVGTEKADNIEGLPKLTGLSTASDQLTYLKPYWYPQTAIINQRIKDGVKVFERLNKEIYDNSFVFSFQELNNVFEVLGKTKFAGNDLAVECKINNKAFRLKREIVAYDVNANATMNELESLCLLLATMMGYGNFWLVLDELDKVDEVDADKFAPMLHIVRERNLKGYNLREFNNTKGADIGLSGDYRGVYNKILESINLNLSLVDTRIIAIGNQSENINEISDALFKRFIQVIATDLIILEKIPPNIGGIMECWTSSGTEIKAAPVDFAFLEEPNLQWFLGFLPRVANTVDEGNFFREDFLSTLSENNEDISSLTMDQVWGSCVTTAIYKMVKDNFSDEPQQRKLVYCIYNQLTKQLGEQKKNNEYFEGGIANEELRSISEKKKLGFNAKQIADDIESDWKMSWANLLMATNTSRAYELDSLIRKAYQFLRSSLGLEATVSIDMMKEFSYPDLITYLLPKFLRFSYMIVLNDEVISSDDIVNLLSNVSLFLQDLKNAIKNNLTSVLDVIAADSDEIIKVGDSVRIGADKDSVKMAAKIEIFGSNVEISTDFEETKKLLYAPENSFYGTDKTPLEIDKFKNSFTFKFAERTNFSAKIEFITKIIKGEITKDEFSKTIINMIALMNGEEVQDYFKQKSLAFLKEKNKMEEYKAYSSLAESFRKIRQEVETKFKKA